MIRKNIDVSLGEDGARPIAMLVQLASQYVSNIEIHRDTMTVNAKSIMGMMTLGLVTGYCPNRDVTVCIAAFLF